jgi:hypothetical protein
LIIKSEHKKITNVQLLNNGNNCRQILVIYGKLYKP